MIYTDTDGVLVDIEIMTAPTIINTVQGEQVAIAGQYLARPENEKPFLLDAETLASSFILVE